MPNSNLKLRCEQEWRWREIWPWGRRQYVWRIWSLAVRRPQLWSWISFNSMQDIGFIILSLCISPSQFTHTQNEVIEPNKLRDPRQSPTPYETILHCMGHSPSIPITPNGSSPSASPNPWGTGTHEDELLEEWRQPGCFSSSFKCFHSGIKSNTEIPPNVHSPERLQTWNYTRHQGLKMVSGRTDL